MVYADYAYYRDTYCGAMPETDFNRLSRQASVKLDLLTFGRITEAMPPAPMTKVKDACCAVADAMLLSEQGDGIASEDNDGIKVSYRAGASKAQTMDERIYAAALDHLGMTGLMYRGY